MANLGLKDKIVIVHIAVLVFLIPQVFFVEGVLPTIEVLSVILAPLPAYAFVFFKKNPEDLLAEQKLFLLSNYIWALITVILAFLQWKFGAFNDDEIFITLLNITSSARLLVFSIYIPRLFSESRG